MIVNGSTNGGNGALDYGDSSDCVCEISGGTLIAAGAIGMDAAPTSGSSQPGGKCKTFFISECRNVCCIERQQRQYSSHSTAIQDIPVRSNVL